MSIAWVTFSVVTNMTLEINVKCTLSCKIINLTHVCNTNTSDFSKNKYDTRYMSFYFVGYLYNMQGAF